MQPTLDTWTSIFLIAASQGIFLAIVIWLKKHHAARFLAAVVMAFSLMLLYYVCFWTGYDTLLPRWIAVLQGMTYLLGPLFYGYMRSDEKTFRIHPLHFLPAGMYLLFFFMRPTLPANIQPLAVTVQVALQALHLAIYAIMAIRVAHLHTLTTSKWNMVLAILFAGYCLSFLLYYMLVWTGSLRIEYDYMISFAAAAFIYFIGYKGYQDKYIFQINATFTKYDRSGLSPSAAEAILADIKKYMEEDKGFLNNDLKLQRLANDLSLSANHVSQVVNDLEGCNFTDFVNRYRVEEAKKLIQEHGSTHKIIQIAYLSGFNNKATFNSAFKKFVGVQPSKFKKLINGQQPVLQ